MIDARVTGLEKLDRALLAVDKNAQLALRAAEKRALERSRTLTTRSLAARYPGIPQKKFRARVGIFLSRLEQLSGRLWMGLEKPIMLSLGQQKRIAAGIGDVLDRYGRRPKGQPFKQRMPTSGKRLLFFRRTEARHRKVGGVWRGELPIESVKLRVPRRVALPILVRSVRSATREVLLKTWRREFRRRQSRRR